MVFDLKPLNKINDIEKQTGVKLHEVLAKVPFTTVVTAVTNIPLVDLVDMVKSVPFEKLATGLQIITLDEITQIDVQQLKTVLKYGDMSTVKRLNDELGEKRIINAMKMLSNSTLKVLLEENDFDDIVAYLEKIGA